VAEPCEDCSCGLAAEDKSTQTTEIPAELQFQSIVRDYVLDQLDMDDEDTFIEQVTICPQKVDVTYRNEE
jgi:hypothetical protein